MNRHQIRTNQQSGTACCSAAARITTPKNVHRRLPDRNAAALCRGSSTTSRRKNLSDNNKSDNKMFRQQQRAATSYFSSGDEEGSSSERSLHSGGSTSTRSQSIAIKTKRQSQQTPSTVDAIITDKMYDWATWRMYYRIVDHRQKYPLSTAYYEEPEARIGTSSAAASSENALGRLPAIVQPMQESMRSYSDWILDGEVFEMDL